MEISSTLLFLCSLIYLLPRPSLSETIFVDGISEWKNPQVFVGDSIIFKHRYHYSLYIFQNQRAFNLCNFTQATPLTNSNSASYTWHPTRLGFFYFSFKNGSSNSCIDRDSQKLAIKVSPVPPPPALEFPPLSSAPIPAPISGGAVPSSPAYSWPFRPREAASSPAPVPSASSPVTMTVPKLVPDRGGGMPFINSNPAVPLPTGEVDSATIRPLPTSSHHQQEAMGLLGIHMALLSAVLVLL